MLLFGNTSKQRLDGPLYSLSLSLKCFCISTVARKMLSIPHKKLGLEYVTPIGNSIIFSLFTVMTI